MSHIKWHWRHKGRKSRCRENQLKIYKSLHKRLINKVRKLEKHMKKLPWDLQSLKVLKFQKTLLHVYK